MSLLKGLFNRKERKQRKIEQAEVGGLTPDEDTLDEDTQGEDILDEETTDKEKDYEEEKYFWQEELDSIQSPLDEDGEYEIVEREILPEKMICPDCGGITLEGLDFCDKCGGELRN